MLAFYEKRQDFRNFRFDRITELAIVQQKLNAPRRVMLAFYCGFRRWRTGIPIEAGQSFRSKADSIPMIADSGSCRRVHEVTALVIGQARRVWPRPFACFRP
jgi:hypothetical protein